MIGPPIGHCRAKRAICLANLQNDKDEDFFFAYSSLHRLSSYFAIS